MWYIRESSIKQKQQSDCVDPLAREPVAKIVPCGKFRSVLLPESCGQHANASLFRRFLYHSQELKRVTSLMDARRCGEIE